MKLKNAVLLSVLTLCGAAFAQTKAPEPDWTVTGNATLISDYRFRGFTQTDFGPALQGGFDVAHKSGFYLGNWNSNVLQGLYNGASLEMDFYGGYKAEIAKDVGYDLGLIYYYYPKSGAAGTTRINNTEVYFGLSGGPLSGKLYYATSDYFQAAKNVGAPRSTRGTTYLDLSYSQDFAGLTFGAHYGLLNLRNNNQPQLTDAKGNPLSHTVSDYKLSVGKDIGNGFILTGAVVGTSKKFFNVTGQPGETKGAGRTALLVSLGKTF